VSKQKSFNWWDSTKSDAHESVFAAVAFLDKNQQYANQDFLRYAKLYGNSDIVGLTSSSYSRVDSSSSQMSRLTLNVIKSCCDTVTAKIAKNKPRPYFLTDGGDWSMQRRAKQMTKFASGMFYKTRIYKTAPRIFLDACVFGLGVVKIFEKDNQQITAERVLPCEIMFDDAEAFYGSPRQIHQVKYIDRAVLKGMFPDKKDEIENANRKVRNDLGVGLNLADQVPVIESWHLQSGPDGTDGRHMMSIDNAVLFMEDYEKETFPFVFLRWTDRLMGFRGTGIAEELMGIQLEINRLLKTIQLSMRLCSVPKVFVENGSKVVMEHINNEIGGIIRYTGQKPNYEAINAVPVELFQQVDRLYSRAYEMSGISALSAQSKKPSGLDSGKALREFSDIESERFATQQQQYEQFFVEAAEQMIDLAKDIYDRDGSFETVAPNQKNIERIKWKDVKMSKDEYAIQIFPTSSLSKTPSGRLQDVQELLQAGFIAREDGLKLLDFPDLEAVLNIENAASEDIDMMIEAMIERSEYFSPEPYQNLILGIRKCQSSYLRAKMNKVPEKNLELIRRWISEAETVLNPTLPEQPEMQDPGMMLDPGMMGAPMANPELPPQSDILPFAQ